jgi:hypothetical protein
VNKAQQQQHVHIGDVEHESNQDHVLADSVGETVLAFLSMTWQDVESQVKTFEVDWMNPGNEVDLSGLFN